jgi:AraC-like DNA-binding protein
MVPSFLRLELSYDWTLLRGVGYGAEAALSNAFLRVVGVRPGAYRKTR